jgi:signal transduction histidine kinase
VENEKKNSVLIVDDVVSNIKTLSHILNTEYAVHAANSGEKAIKAAEYYLPDVILLDILMPEMDGYEVIRILKSSEKTQNIPVIFITGLNDSENEEAGLTLGAADYISKPFSPAIVRLRVRNQIKIINQTRLIIAKELAEKSSRAKGEFLSRMSHEMRTPMNAIMGMTRLAMNAADSEQRRDMLKKVELSSSRLIKLIDDVLDISSMEDNKLSLVRSEVKFAGMIQEILDTAKQRAAEKRQLLTTEIDPAIPDILICDGKRLSQVILNLLSNAIKFTPEQGSIQVNAFVREKENETLIMQVEVIDSGIGISREQQEIIFTPFEQADGGIDRKFGGAGLGLAIAKHIVGLMGGEIWVESEPGRGSKFAFTIKMEFKAPEIKEDGPVSLEGKTALLVDDVEINREIVIAMLGSTGLRFTCAVDGREALELFSNNPGGFDVILMDINMPVMDGVEATRRIRALEAPEGALVPIIAMTANIHADEVEKYLAAGMNGHIGKPLDFDLLLSMLEKHLITAKHDEAMK